MSDTPDTTGLHTPCVCEKCRRITLDQWAHIVAEVRRDTAERIAQAIERAPLSADNLGVMAMRAESARIARAAIERNR